MTADILWKWTAVQIVCGVHGDLHPQNWEILGPASLWPQKAEQCGARGEGRSRSGVGPDTHPHSTNVSLSALYFQQRFGPWYKALYWIVHMKTLIQENKQRTKFSPQVAETNFTREYKKVEDKEHFL